VRSACCGAIAKSGRGDRAIASKTLVYEKLEIAVLTFSSATLYEIR
jgi:hypothetical protein